MIWYVTNVDTEVLALRVAVEALPDGFGPVRAARPSEIGEGLPLDDARCVMVRLLGGRRAWEGGLDALAEECRRRHIPLLAFGGEAVPDAEMSALSTVPSATVTQAFEYLVYGGPANFTELCLFVADTVLMEGHGFALPTEVPLQGVWRRPSDETTNAASDGSGDSPLVGIVFYRAHLVAGNTRFVDDLCDAVEAAGGRALAIWCYSLRDEAARPVVDLLVEAGVDVLVTTVLAAGGVAAGAGADGGSGGLDGEAWDASELTRLDVPILQSPSSGWSRAEWEASDAGLGPYDATSGVVVPELDGRIAVPVSTFNEVVDDGDELGVAVRAYRTVPDRVERVARLAVRHGALRHTPPEERRVALVMSAFPTRRGRLGNAVGLDTPASVLSLLAALDADGYSVEGVPASGDALMATLADGLIYESETLTAAELELSVGRMPVDRYAAWFATLPATLQADVTTAWGPPPGRARVHEGEFVFSGMACGNVLVAVQPPRGYGDDPIAVYHSPNLAPTHHYLAFYRWLDEVWGADAIVHMGKHGTLEWLPGKSLALSSSCAPDAALGDVPFIYPFVVNDPGEGSQAKRRTHAVVIDHLVPPLVRAETYGDLARLEQLFDHYAQLQVLDPAKLPACRAQIWELVRQASLHEDLGLESSVAPEADDFDEMVLHIDGYLCELKDSQIRGGLHTLGAPPAGDDLVSLVLAVTRLGHGRHIPSLREACADRLGLNLGNATTLDQIEQACREMVEAACDRGWMVTPRGEEPAPMDWVCEWLVPNLLRTGDEISNLLVSLSGRHVPAGPSGSLTRGGAHVLPTGRNFYSVDPKALPTELSWDVGKALADRLLERHLEEEGCYPNTVGLVLWGTAAMRTQGDDVAEVCALLGVRPVWEQESRRVTGLEVISLAELGRPRIDVTLRISGFFRDAFPNLVHLLDEAIELAARQDEPAEDNFVRAHVLAEHRAASAAGSTTESEIAATGLGPELASKARGEGEGETELIIDPRIFGPGPGAYGTGILDLLEQRDWRSDDDLAAVYIAWSGHAYGRIGYGVPAEGAMRRRFAAIDVAVKNQDNREHDIFDSDDYLQEHGGMIATIRSLTGRDPKAWFGDSADPANPKVLSLAEEAARVVRSRVVNPRWIEAMRRHGYKGAAEMAATVDYLFGYDATAHVVADWMYEKVTESYLADPEQRAFFERSNPWAMGAIAERLLEAADRGMWNADADSIAVIRDALLLAEGWEEGRDR